MAQIRKRGPSQYQARVRLIGHPEVARTFSSRQEAATWANEREKILLQGLGDAIRAADNLTLYGALERYATEVTPTKKGRQQELSRLRRWQRNSLADQPLSRIRGADLARYRDFRQEQGAGANTIRLDLALISHLFEVARKDWGFEMLNNPAKAMRKPKLPRGRDRRLLPGEEAKLLSYCDAVGNHLLKAVIIVAIETAMRRGEITVHSDQGSQFSSYDWQDFLKAHNLRASMSRRGNCHDNAVAESFFQLLKRERIRRKIYNSREEARQDVFDYIEMFYNPKRRHGYNNRLSPVDYEKQYFKRLASV